MWGRGVSGEQERQARGISIRVETVAARWALLGRGGAAWSTKQSGASGAGDLGTVEKKKGGGGRC